MPLPGGGDFRFERRDSFTDDLKADLRSSLVGFKVFFSEVEDTAGGGRGGAFLGMDNEPILLAAPSTTSDEVLRAP